jgi:hypothetical protein
MRMKFEHPHDQRTNAVRLYKIVDAVSHCLRAGFEEIFVKEFILLGEEGPSFFLVFKFAC